MAMFLLVRHAENDYVRKNRLAGRLPGIHLNEKGRNQALAIAERLSTLPVKAVYSSPLERALETAEPIARALNLEVMQRFGLIEMDLGEWQDQRLKELSRTKMWATVQGNPSRMHFPGGESFADAQHRISQELELLNRQHDPKDILACITHSDVIKLAVAYFVGMPLDTFQRLHVAPASITTLFLGGSSSKLLTLNYEINFSLLQD